MSLYLFADNNEGTAENLGSYRLYNMKIEGDLEEIKADEINYIDYIESDGASYIDLPGDTITYNDNFKIEVQCNRIPLCHVVGTSSNYGQTLTQLLYEGSTNFLQAHMYGARVCYTAYTNLVSGTGVETFTLSPTSVYVNGTMLVSIETASANYPTDNDFRIFGRGGSWDTQISKAGLRIYYVKLWNGDTLLYHLKPCLDEEGIPCMYDEVSGEYFYNQGTGTFGYKKELRDFQPVLDSNGIPCLMDNVNKKYYYDKNGNLFGCEQDDYQRVGYLEGDGNSWIDTGIYANPQYKYELVCNDSGSGAGLRTYERYFGVSDSTMSLRNKIGEINFMYLNQMYAGQTIPYNQKHTIIVDKHDVYVDNQLVASASQSTDTTIFDQTVFLFDDNYHSGTSEDLKVYSFKIYNENNELMFDGVPVLDSEGTPCMYDLVTETFFYNQGTGEFSYGIEEDECPKANYVEYLKAPNTNNQIDTGITYDNTYSKIEFKFNTNNCNTTDEILRAGNNRNFWFKIHYGSIQFLNCGYTFENGASVDIDVTITSTECIINGITYTYETPLNSVSQNMLLFSYSKWIKLYYFRVYDSEGNLIQDLHPSLDNDKIPCMYDTVSDSYFYSNGNDTFEHGKSIGYTPIKYIETNGTQYIDTGVVPTDNTDIDMVASAVGETPLYLINGLTIDTTYKYNEVDTTVEPNLTASDGATLTLGSTYMAYLTESEIEQAVDNGWTIQ